ncbi:MAG: hypothetical protein WBE85_02280 [Methylocella sp.]
MRDRVARDLESALLRGDCGFGNAPIMETEQRGLAYLFKLRLTANVKRMIEPLSTQREWTNSGHGRQATESIRRQGWSKAARGDRVAAARAESLGDGFECDAGPAYAIFCRNRAGAEVHEYFVLAASRDEERAGSAQLDRDRGVSQEYFRRVDEPSGQGRLGHAGPCALPAGHPHDRIVFRLVEHLRSSGRAGQA